MTIAIHFKTIFCNVAILLVVANLFVACADNSPKSTPTPEATPPKSESITVSGLVKSVEYGKDGYTATVLTEKNETFAALVSIVNVGGPENYNTCEVDDRVNFNGIPTLLGDAKQLKVTKIISISSPQIRMLIAPNAFRGIQIGDPIAKHKDYTQKTKLKTGEGTFDVYEIKDFDNNPAGYLLPDPNNKLLVGDITVQTPKAATAERLKVGSTLQDLLRVFPNIEVHGSEIEGRTSAIANNLSYRLDAANFTYQIDASKIPATTKITEITINRKVKK